MVSQWITLLKIVTLPLPFTLEIINSIEVAGVFFYYILYIYTMEYLFVLFRYT